MASIPSLDTEIIAGLESGELACLAERSAVNTDRAPGLSGASHCIFSLSRQHSTKARH